MTIPTNLRIGTSSWSAEDWAGPFYPAGTRPAEFLEHYATRFDTVEIDATFYRIPSAKMVDGWRARTPDGFTFAAKVPQSITHERELVDCDDDARAFLDVMGRLGNRLGPLLLQFPYWAKVKDAAEYETGDRFRERLAAFLDRISLSHPESRFRFAVDVRNEKWIRPPLLELLRERNVALALLDYYTMPRIDRLMKATDPVTTDFIYVRLLGDHKRMDRIVQDRAKQAGDKRLWHAVAVDRSAESKVWAAALQELAPKVSVAYIFVNNHYAGHAPGSIDLLRSLMSG